MYKKKKQAVLIGQPVNITSSISTSSKKLKKNLFFYQFDILFIITLNNLQ